MESEEEEAKERQENELQVLQSIFMEDVQDLRKKEAWKVWRPLDVEILLRPQQSMSDHAQEVHAHISMCVKCSKDYPNRAPSIDLKNAKGLSKAQVQDIKKQLISLANQLKGEVMILELSQHVQKFLHSHNKPGFQSFYEEMLCNKRRQEEELAKEEFRRNEVERKRQELQQQAIQEEIQRKQDALKEEARKRRTHIMRISETSDSDSGLRNSSPPKLISSSPKQDQLIQSCRKCSGSSESDLPKILTLHSGHDERSIQLLKCLGNSCRGSSTYLGVDLMNVGDLFAVTEWSLCLASEHGRRRTTPDDVLLLKQVNSLEQEMSTISKIKHKNLLQYFGLNQEKQKDKIVIHLVQEFVVGNTLASFLHQNLPLDTSLLRHYSQSIVETLMFLHSASVIHRDLRASSIFIDSLGTIRLGDYSLDKKLNDLCCPSSPHSNGYPLTFGKGGKKGDVYRLGIILLSSSVGKLITDLVPKIPTHLVSALKDFLQKCLQPNEHERWTCEQLFNHPFIHDTLHNIPIPEKTGSDNEKMKEEESELEPSLLPLIGSHHSGRSRLQTEFEVLQWLGKGGFGDVLKVRNKLDGRHYAIKKISLNPSRQQLNRKIMREVKLLSRLNHENVVRYYNSWIETTTEQFRPGEESNSCSSSQIIIDSAPKSLEVLKLKSSIDDVEKLAPSQVEGSVEWSVSFEISSHPPHAICQEDSSDDEEDVDYVFGTSFLSHSIQDSVIFENSKEQDSIAEEDSKPTQPSTTEESNIIPRSSQFMYIQMEFCERSTLRIAIDNDLHKEAERMWRLFREIIEGLGHIHQQGMIHRDLKPVNIFLDVNDHVKIGDFGLATTDIIQKASLVADGAGGSAPMEECEVSHSDLIGDGSMTGAVGTALYLAPELLAPSTSRILYSQKVDLYSLGIIFFEMCYPAPSTGMERVNLLVNLRQKDIFLPNDYLKFLSPQQVHLIRWLLPHDPNQRPTAEELLSSDCLPPPLMEEAELNEMLRHTVSNPQSKGYKRMMAALFRQRLTPAADFSYDMDVHKASVHHSLAFHTATNTLQNVMQKHGAVQMQIPTLMPKTSHSHQQSEATVRLMDHGGALVILPINLRVSLARFIARHDLGPLKRYALEKVYREKKVYGCHPRELYECTFDIVTPSSENLLPDAEVLAMVSEVISEFPVLQNRNYYIRMNHFGLLRAILLHCGIIEEKHKEICHLLVEYKLKGLSKFQMGNHLTNLGLSDHSMSLLLQLTEHEDCIQKIASLLKAVTKRKGQVAVLATQSLRELQTIINYAEILGLKVPVIVSPGFAYEPGIYSGMVFQFICELSKKGRKGRMDVLAAGGRYDQLVSSFRLSPTVVKGTTTNSNSVVQSQPVSSAVGVSIAIEKIISAVMEEEMTGVLDVMVCSVGNSPMVKDKCTLLKSLWTAGVHAHAIYEPGSLEEAREFCKENRVNHLLILKESELGFVKMRTFDKERFTEKKIALNEFVENVPKFLTYKSEQCEGGQLSRLEQSRSSSSILDGSGDPKPNSFSGSSACASMSVTFMALDEKITGSNKRRIEAQLQGQMQNLLPLLSGRVNIEVLVVELAAYIVKTIASQLELDPEDELFQSSLRTITEKYPRYRKYLTRLAEHIHDLRFEKRCPVIVLYSSVDNIFKVML